MRLTAIALVVLALGAVGTASCDSVTPLSADGGAGAGGAAGTGGGAGAGGGAGTDGAAGSTQGGGAGAAGGSKGVVVYAPGCPGALFVPNDGFCAPPEVCEYRASDAHPTCVTRFECSGPAPSWHETDPPPACGTRGGWCPSSYAQVMQGASCSLQLGPCDYDEGRCGCLPCSSAPPGTQGVWSCRAWNTGGDGCPPVSPLAGTACTTEDQLCMYSGLCSISVGEDFQCTKGFWQPTPSVAGSCIMRTCPVTGP